MGIVAREACDLPFLVARQRLGVFAGMLADAGVLEFPMAAETVLGGLVDEEIVRRVLAGLRKTGVAIDAHRLAARHLLVRVVLVVVGFAAPHAGGREAEQQYDQQRERVTSHSRPGRGSAGKSPLVWHSPQRMGFARASMPCVKRTLAS